jgi:hypothetical protein
MRACDGLVSRLDGAEGRISEQEDKTAETPQGEKQKEKKDWKPPRRDTQELYDIYKSYNKCIMGILERRKREKSKRNI